MNTKKRSEGGKKAKHNQKVSSKVQHKKHEINESRSALRVSRTYDPNPIFRRVYSVEGSG